MVCNALQYAHELNELDHTIATLRLGREVYIGSFRTGVAKMQGYLLSSCFEGFSTHLR